MSFLAPLFLLGGAAIALPVIFHLVRRTTRERAVFSSLMFLLPSPPRLSKRHRLEHWLLLVLRCLALALLALGFARPFFRQAPLVDPTAAQPTRRVVLVDTSASMRREGVWAAARGRVDALLRQAGPADQVALFTFDGRAVPVLTFEEWNRAPAGDRAALASARLAALTPGWGGTRLGNALITAAESLAEADQKNFSGRRQVVLVSDLQAGSRLDALQAYEWPKGVELTVESVAARTKTNAGLQLVADAAEAPRGSEAGVVRVRVSNSADAAREQFTVGWSLGDAAGGFAGAPVEIYVPPGQSRVVALPAPKGASAPDRIVLRGDDDDFDNTVFAIPPVQQRVDVLWLGREAADDARGPLFFLRRALNDTSRLAVRVTARAPDAPLVADEVAAAGLIFVTEPVGEAAARALREQALAGKTLVVLPRSPAAAATVAALVGADGLQLAEMRPASYAMFGEIDFQHPLFAPFADPRFSDFTKIHVWQYRKFDAGGIAGARVVAKFDSGDPAIVDVPAGRGRIVVLASGWQPDDSQLAVSSKFVPLLWSLLELGGGAAVAPSQFGVGDPVTLPVAAGATASVRTPTGENVALTSAEFAATTQPGIYELTGGARPVRFAVNLDPNESRTAPLAADELDRLGLPVHPASPVPALAAAERSLLQAAEAENRQKLWRWLVAATLAVLLVETALAGWTARRAELKTQEVIP